jgi:hypothetical protein
MMATYLSVPSLSAINNNGNANVAVHGDPSGAISSPVYKKRSNDTTKSASNSSATCFS